MTTPGEGGLFHFRQDIDVALGEIKRSLESFPGRIDPIAQRINDALFFGAAFSTEGINQFLQELEGAVGRAETLAKGAGAAISENLANGGDPQKAFSAFTQVATDEVHKIQRIFQDGLAKGLVPPGISEQLTNLARKVQEAFKGVGGSLPGAPGGGGGFGNLDAVTNRLVASTQALVASFDKEVQAAEVRIAAEQVLVTAQRNFAQAVQRDAQALETDANERKAAQRQAREAGNEVARAQTQLARATKAEADASATRRGVSAAAERELAEAAVRAQNASLGTRPVLNTAPKPEDLLAEANPASPQFRQPTAENPNQGRTFQLPGTDVFARQDDANAAPRFIRTFPAVRDPETGGRVLPPSSAEINPADDPVKIANLQRKYEETLARSIAAQTTDNEARERLTAAANLLARVEEGAVRQLSATRFFDTESQSSFNLKATTRSGGALEASEAGQAASAQDAATVAKRNLQEQERLGGAISKELEGRTAVARDLAERQKIERAITEQQTRILAAQELLAAEGRGSTRLGAGNLVRNDASGDVFKLRDRPELGPDGRGTGAQVTEAEQLTAQNGLVVASRALAKQDQALADKTQAAIDQQTRVNTATQLLDPAVRDYVKHLERAGLVLDQTSGQIFRLRNEKEGTPLAGKVGATELTGVPLTQAQSQFAGADDRGQRALGAETAKLTEQEIRLAAGARALADEQNQLVVRIGTTNQYYDLQNRALLKLTRETSGPGRDQIGATTTATGAQAAEVFAAELGRLQGTAIRLNEAMRKDTVALELEARQADLAAKLDDGRAQTLRGGSIRDLTNGKTFTNNGAQEITNPLQLRRINAASEPPKGLVDSFLGGLTSKGFNSEGDESPGLTGIAGTAGNLAKYGLVAAALQDVFKAVGALKAGVLDESAALVNLSEALETTRANSVDYADAANGAADAGLAGADAINIGAKAVQAYGQEIRNNTDANKVFAESIKQVGVAAVITGLATADAQKALIQSTAGFGLGSAGQGRINNAVSNAARNFGGDRGEILKATGGASAAADTVGISPEQLANISSLIQSRTQQTGTQISEALIRLLARSGDPKFNEALARAGVQNTGNIAREIPELSAFFNKQTGPSKAQFIKDLGGRGALGDIVPLLQSGDQLGAATEKSLTNGGAAAEDFSRRINSIGGQIKTIVAEFKDLAEEIGKSGVFTPIGVALEALKPVLALLDSALKTFNKLPAPVREGVFAIIELAGAIKVAQAAAAAGITLRGLVGLGAAKATATATRVSGAIAAGAGAGAESADAVSTGANTSATNANTAAKRANASATVLEAEAESLSSRASATATVNLVELNVAVSRRIAAIRQLGVLEGEELAAARAGITVIEAETLVREAATAAIAEEAAALAVLNAEQRGSLGAGVAGGAASAGRLARSGGGAVAAEEAAGAGLLSRAGTGIRGFLGSTAGLITVAVGAAIAVKSLIGETDRLRQSYDKQTEAAQTAANATDAAGLEAAAAGLSEAGAGRAKGASGIFGTPEDAIIRLFGGQGGRAAQKEDEQVSKQLVAEANNIRNQQDAAAARGDAGAFNGRISSIEQLTTGIGKLDAAGASAASEVQAIVDAFTGVAKVSPAVASAALSGKFTGAVGDSIQEVLGKPTRNFEINGSKTGDVFPFGTKSIAEGLSSLTGGSGNFDNATQQFVDPKKIADTRKKISDLVQKSVDDAGVLNASDLSADQKADLATKIAALYTGDSHVRGDDLAKIQALIAQKVNANLADIANTIPGGDQITSAAVQAQLVQKAAVAGQQAGSLAGGDPVAAARANLTALQETARVAGASGTQQTVASQAAVADAQRALADGLTAQGKAYNDLAATLRPADAAHNLALALDSANQKLANDIAAGASAVTQVQDQAAINTALTAQRAGQFADQNSLNLSVRGGNANNLSFGADGSVTGGAVDPRDQTGQANARLTNARNNLNLARSEGATGKALGDAVGAYTQAYFDYATAVVTDSNAARDAAVKVGDKVGDAYAKATDAYKIAASLRAGSPQQAAAFRNAAQLFADANILSVQTAVAVDTQNTDPRNKVRVASDQLELDTSTLAATPQADAAAGAALRKKIKADRIALDQAQFDQITAQREANTDPRNVLAEAGQAVVRARGQIVLSLPGTQAYAEAQKTLRVALQAQRAAYAALANAQGEARTDSRDTIGEATQAVNRATRNLSLQLKGTAAYADAQKALAVALLARAVAVTTLANDKRDAAADPASRVQQAAARLADTQAILKNDLKGSDQYYKDLKAVNDAKVALAEANLAAARDSAELKIDTTDPVAEANLAAKTARDKLASDRKRGAAPDVINADLLQVEKTGESAQKALLDQQLSLHATQFQLRQISLAQYLTFLRGQDASLRAQLAATKKGSEGYQQLVDELNGVDQTIQGLNATAAGLFNIGDIKAPTVFQIRTALGVDSKKDPTVFAPVTSALTSVAQPAVQAAARLGTVAVALDAVTAAATATTAAVTPGTAAATTGAAAAPATAPTAAQTAAAALSKAQTASAIQNQTLAVAQDTAAVKADQARLATLVKGTTAFNTTTAALAADKARLATDSALLTAQKGAAAAGLLVTPTGGTTAAGGNVVNTVNNVSINGVDFAKVVSYINSILGAQAARSSTTPKRVR